jgi:hypothetical protein
MNITIIKKNFSAMQKPGMVRIEVRAFRQPRTLEARNETSTPEISASGGGRCRVARAVV